MQPLTPNVKVEHHSPAKKHEDVDDLLNTLEESSGSNPPDENKDQIKGMNLSVEGNKEISAFQKSEDDGEQIVLKYEPEELPDEEEYSIGPHFLANVLPMHGTELARDVKSKT